MLYNTPTLKHLLNGSVSRVVLYNSMFSCRSLVRLLASWLPQSHKWLPALFVLAHSNWRISFLKAARQVKNSKTTLSLFLNEAEAVVPLGRHSSSEECCANGLENVKQRSKSSSQSSDHPKPKRTFHSFSVGGCGRDTGQGRAAQPVCFFFVWYCFGH